MSEESSMSAFTWSKADAMSPFRSDVAKIPRTVGNATLNVAGPLTRHIAGSAFAQDILSRLDSDGYVVLQNVLSADESERELGRMWDWVEKVSPGVNRVDPESWYSRNSLDPWPHASRDMMQLYQAGWLFGELREALGTRVFEPLYGTRKLHCSKDGFCFQRPTKTDPKRRPIDHFDQSGCKLGLHCIQGSVALLDQESGDGCFSCWPGSHRHHARIAGKKPKPSDWFVLSDADKASLTEAGCAELRIPVNRGDVVLWRSDLVHMGGSPIGRRRGFRSVVYVCMLPSQLTPDSIYGKKAEAYAKLATGSHWPTKEEWFCPRHNYGRPRLKAMPYFDSQPKLSKRLQELYGLRRYDNPD